MKLIAKARKITILIVLLIVVLIVVGTSNMQKKEDGTTSETELGIATAGEATPTDDIKIDIATMTDSVAEEITSDGDAEEVFAQATTEEIEEEPLPSSVSLELELVYQYPELPTGCESVALTMLLKYYDFDLNKTTIAKDYLIYSTNFVEGYMGNPFTTGGAGIYSPGLTRTANKYLDAQESDLNAKNVTDSTPEELYRYVAEGTPVVVWNTIYFIPNNPTGLKIKWGKKTYEWDRSEHCMVLSGYDLERNVVIVHDPIEGIVERDAAGFWEKYEKLGSMALIIR